MKLISFGGACVTKFQIIKHNFRHNIEDGETNLFDWQLTSFKVILEILKTDNIDNIFNKENVRFEEIFSNNSKVVFKSLNHFISLHDLSIDYTEEDLDIFIDKCKRRYERMINIIKNNDTIIFIRFDDNNIINNDDYLEFKNILYDINPNFKFYFFNLIINLELENNINLINEYFYKVNLKNYLTFEKVDITGGSFECFNWIKIFDDIKNEIENINVL